MRLKEYSDSISFKKLTPVGWSLIFVVFFSIHIPAIRHAQGIMNDYEVLARSICKGNFWFKESDLPFVKGTEIPDTGDLIFYQDKYYLPYPPAPAFLLIPFVLMSKGPINCVFIAVILGFLSILLLYSIFIRLSIPPRQILWLIFGFTFGTSYWFVLLSAHHVYGFAEMVSVAAVLLALNELLGKRRSILMGLFITIAFLSRQFTIIIGVFIIGYLFNQYALTPKQKNLKTLWKKAFLFCTTVGVGVVLYCLYNYTRFQNPLDTGYSHINFLGVLKERVNQYGVFSPHYVLYNIYNYLFKGFNIDFQGKMMLQIKDVDLFGSALLVSSPFLVASFKSTWDKIPKVVAWVSIALIFTGLLFYHNNGKDQVNACRFTLDFLPLMIVLTALGIKNIPSWLFKGLVSYSVILNAIALFIHFYYH